MIYHLGKKTINIPNREIDSLMNSLSIDKEEAIQLWLDDNDYTTNEEADNLTKKITQMGIDHGIDKAKDPDKKKYTRKISKTKQKLFSDLMDFVIKNLSEQQGFKYKIIKDNKMIVLEAEDKTQFKIDLIETTATKRIKMD